MKVVFSTPDWTISGVNSFNHNLMRGLQAAGHDVELLLIPIGAPAQAELPLPTDVPVRQLRFETRDGYFAGRWKALTAYLNGLAPCIYLPGYDFNNSCVAPCLSDGVGIVGVVHSDDPYHYEHLIRLGRYWNAAVAVSSFLHRKMLEVEPGVAGRSAVIHYGVAAPPSLPERSGGDRPLRILFAGRFTEEQKRVSDLPKIASELVGRGVPVEWTLIGAGAQDSELRAAFARIPAPAKVRFTGAVPADEVPAYAAAADVLILTSTYEGLPLSLLEAMARGAIPVVTAIESGIPDVVRDGVNGFTLPVGDIEGFAARLAWLHANPAERQALHRAAFDTIARGPFSIEAVTDRYVELFERVQREAAEGVYRRAKSYRIGSLTGDVVPPPHLQFTPDLYYELKSTVDTVRRVLGPFKGPVRAMLRAYHRRWRWGGSLPAPQNRTMQPAIKQ